MCCFKRALKGCTVWPIYYVLSHSQFNLYITFFLVLGFEGLLGLDKMFFKVCPELKWTPTPLRFSIFWSLYPSLGTNGIV